MQYIFGAYLLLVQGPEHLLLKEQNPRQAK